MSSIFARISHRTPSVRSHKSDKHDRHDRHSRHDKADKHVSQANVEKKDRSLPGPENNHGGGSGNGPAGLNLDSIPNTVTYITTAIPTSPLSQKFSSPSEAESVTGSLGSNSSNDSQKDPIFEFSSPSSASSSASTAAVSAGDSARGSGSGRASHTSGGQKHAPLKLNTAAYNPGALAMDPRRSPPIRTPSSPIPPNHVFREFDRYPRLATPVASPGYNSAAASHGSGMHAHTSQPSSTRSSVSGYENPNRNNTISHPPSPVNGGPRSRPTSPVSSRPRAASTTTSLRGPARPGLASTHSAERLKVGTELVQHGSMPSPSTPGPSPVGSVQAEPDLGPIDEHQPAVPAPDPTSQFMPIEERTFLSVSDDEDAGFSIDSALSASILKSADSPESMSHAMFSSHGGIPTDLKVINMSDDDEPEDPQSTISGHQSAASGQRSAAPHSAPATNHTTTLTGDVATAHDAEMHDVSLSDSPEAASQLPRSTPDSADDSALNDSSADYSEQAEHLYSSSASSTSGDSVDFDGIASQLEQSLGKAHEEQTAAKAADVSARQVEVAKMDTEITPQAAPAPFHPPRRSSSVKNSTRLVTSARAPGLPSIDSSAAPSAGDGVEPDSGKGSPSGITDVPSSPLSEMSSSAKDFSGSESIDSSVSSYSTDHTVKQDMGSGRGGLRESAAGLRFTPNLSTESFYSADDYTSSSPLSPDNSRYLTPASYDPPSSAMSTSSFYSTMDYDEDAFEDAEGSERGDDLSTVRSTNTSMTISRDEFRSFDHVVGNISDVSESFTQSNETSHTTDLTMDSDVLSEEAMADAVAANIKPKTLSPSRRNMSTLTVQIPVSPGRLALSTPTSPFKSPRSAGSMASSPATESQLSFPTSQSPPKRKGIKTVGSFLEKAKLHKPDINVPSLKSLKITDAATIASAQLNAELVKSLEHELRQVSTDLAASIKREMDLEMMLDKFATTESNADGFGDDDNSSGDESVNSHSYRNSFYAKRLQELEKKLRSEQQEKAQMRVEFLQSLDAERERSRELETRLGETRSRKVRAGRDAWLTAQHEPSDEVQAKLSLLESALDDARRKLTFERSNGHNLEYLLASMKEELEDDSKFSHDKIENRSLSVSPHMLSGASSPVASEMSAATGARWERERLYDLSRPSSKGNLEEPERVLSKSVSQHSLGSMTSGASAHQEATEQIKDLESQREALQQAIRSLRERYTLELKHSNDKVKSLEAQLNRERGRSKAIAARRPIIGNEAPGEKGEVAAIKSSLSLALAENAMLEKNFALVRDKLCALFDYPLPASDDGSHSPQEPPFDCARLLATIEDAVVGQRLDWQSTVDALKGERHQLKDTIAELNRQLDGHEEHMRVCQETTQAYQSSLLQHSINEKRILDQNSSLTDALAQNSLKLERLVGELSTHLVDTKSLHKRVDSWSAHSTTS
ncbi:uncharacterized protein V1510DRAFT_413135 [Dipodascopsis tothii]|uniref:uncharacterized protein n=1 Tax=Dipodascopsis tothii TaxID=44089 RepID=UPI0034CDFBEA